MSKKGVSAVSGVITPIIGEKYTYQIAAWYPDTPNSRRDPAKVTWELFRKRSNGKFTTTNIKKKGDSSFTFGQTALGGTYRLEGYLDHAEGGGLIIEPKTDKIPRITKVELFYVDDSKGSTFSFREKLRTKADCVNMFNKELIFTLWEDDAKNPGHNKNNKPIATKTKKVDKNGMAVVEFTLIDALMRKAVQGEADPKQLEFYVTVEYYVHKKHSTENKNIDNPFPTKPSTPQVPSRSETPRATQTPTPSSPTLPPNNPEPLAVPKAEGSPAEQKSPSKKEENGITDIVTKPLGNLWDYVEIIGKAIKDQLPTISQPDGATASVKNTTVEGLLDAYFAKEEYTKETGESAGSHTYKFKKENTKVNKDEIAGIIKGKIEDSLKAEKKYVKLNDIKNALPSSYIEGGTISFATYKLGPQYTKITSAPLEDEVYVIAQTMKLDGKEVTINIKEKETILVEESANISVLEAKENGNELTELKAIVQDGIAKVKVKLRPKSDEDLKKWKEKLQGVKDGTHTYTFGGNNDTSTEANKKSVAQVIVGKVKQLLATSNKFAKVEDIVTAFNKIPTKKSYGKDEQITFDVYKSVTEQWWLKAECTGEKKHEGEFLKKEGAYFTIGGGNCSCNRNLTESEFKEILKYLRESEKLEINDIWKPRNAGGANPTDISLSSTLAKFNKIMDYYEINTCIRKVYFIAECYHETDRFYSTREYNNSKTDGYDPHRGRGIIQLTHKEAYERFAFYRKDNSLLSSLNTIATNLDLAFDSAGWYFKQGKLLTVGDSWSPNSTDQKKYKLSTRSYPKTNYDTKFTNTDGSIVTRYGSINLNLVADNDDINVLSYLINGGDNGLDERKKYVGELKKISFFICEKSTQQAESGKWHDPVDNPQLCLYSQGGESKKPWHGSFGPTIRDGINKHTGMDLFAKPGSKVYACVKSKVVRSEINSTMFGEMIVLKVIDEETIKSRRKNPFLLKYAHKSEIESQNFDHNGPFYLVFAHLKERKVEIGDIVDADKVIGLTGTSGNNGVPFSTKNPHLHFEIMNVERQAGLNNKCNPGVYLTYKDEDSLTPSDIAKQEEARTTPEFWKQ